MTERDNDRVVRDIVNAINSQDLDALLDHLADEVTAFLSGFDETVDKEGMRECWAGWYMGFPDLTYHADRTVSQGNTVVVEATATGTQKREFLGIPPTNKKAEARVIWIFDFEAGKVKLWKEYVNFPGFAVAQLERFLRA